MGDVRELFDGEPPKPENTPEACRAVHSLIIVQYDPNSCGEDCTGCAVETTEGTKCTSVPILNMGVYPAFSDAVEGPIHVCSDDGHIDFVATRLISDIVEHEVGINVFDKIMETGTSLGLDNE